MTLKSVRFRTTVKPGGRVEISNLDMPPGEEVEIEVRLISSPGQIPSARVSREAPASGVSGRRQDNLR